MKKSRIKFTALGLAAVIGVSCLFSGCGSGSSHYSMSDALGKYRLWFSGEADWDENQKNTPVYVYLVKDGKVSEIDDGRAEGSDLLTLGEIAGMTDDEILEYYSVRPARCPETDLSLRIATDGSGNNTDSEYIHVKYYYFKMYDDGSLSEEPDSEEEKDLRFTGTFSGLSIYDACFSGFYSDDDSFFTRVDSSDVTFALDQPGTDGVEVD